MTEKLREVLRKSFGYNDFRCDEQKKAAQEIYDGKRDVFVSMPTGAGKRGQSSHTDATFASPRQASSPDICPSP